jgi:hypothetical protein
MEKFLFCWALTTTTTATTFKIEIRMMDNVQKIRH